MYQLYSSGDYDYRSLAKKMYVLGLRSKRDNFVNHSRIEDYLSNPFYCGQFKWEGKLSGSNESYPPLITTELWEEVQNIKAERSRQTRTTYAGKICKGFKYHGLKCSLCGSAIVGMERHKTLRKSGKPVSYIYYHCCQAKGKCRLDWFREEELDRYFNYAFGDLEELTLTPDIYENARKKLEEDYNDNRNITQEELIAQRKELVKIDSQSQALNHHLISGAIKPDAYTEMREALSKRKIEVETRISELERADEVFVDFACESLKLLSDFKIKYLHGNLNFRKKLNTLLFKTISLTPKREPGKRGINLKCLQLEWNEPFATLFENYKEWFLNQEKLEEEYFEQEKKFGGADET